MIPEPYRPIPDWVLRYLRNVIDEIGEQGMDEIGLVVNNGTVIQLIEYIDELEEWVDNYRIPCLN